MFLVPESDINKTFQKNTSLVQCGNSNALIQWYTMRNRICKEIGVGQRERNSIPLGWNEQEARIFLNEIKKGSTTWKTMKLVLLGDGRVGKSTLLNRIKFLQQQIPSHSTV